MIEINKVEFAYYPTANPKGGTGAILDFRMTVTADTREHLHEEVAAIRKTLYALEKGDATQ